MASVMLVFIKSVMTLAFRLHLLLSAPQRGIPLPTDLYSMPSTLKTTRSERYFKPTLSLPTPLPPPSHPLNPPYLNRRIRTTGHHPPALHPRNPTHTLLMRVPSFHPLPRVRQAPDEDISI